MLILAPIQLAPDHWLWTEYDKNRDGTYSVFFSQSRHGKADCKRFNRILKTLSEYRVEERVNRYFRLMGIIP